MKVWVVNTEDNTEVLDEKAFNYRVRNMAVNETLTAGEHFLSWLEENFTLYDALYAAVNDVMEAWVDECLEYPNLLDLNCHYTELVKI